MFIKLAAQTRAYINKYCRRKLKLKEVCVRACVSHRLFNKFVLFLETYALNIIISLKNVIEVSKMKILEKELKKNAMLCFKILIAV